MNRYLRTFYYVYNDKSPNSCLATVEAFIKFYVLRFILYVEEKISRYYELPSLKQQTKYQAPRPNHTQ